MIVREIARRLALEARAGGDALDAEVRGGYVGDLISIVIAHGSEGDLWVTHQTHVNTVAAAALKGLAGIVLADGREPEPDTREKAEEERMPLLVSRLSAFELVGRMHALGLSGGGA
jgi:hypothetical protein